jgi:putative phosphoribosyl transferase
VAYFSDRLEAGRALAERLRLRSDLHDAIVLALPRGGVPIGFEIASALSLPLEVFVVRKLGLPGEEELALGAVATGGFQVLNRPLIEHLRIPAEVLTNVAAREERVLADRERLYRGDRAAPALHGRVVVLVDDGLATGASMLVAIAAVRPQGPEKIIVAVPVAAPGTCAEIRKYADDLICLRYPHPFGSVGMWYERFGQVSDDEVRSLLERARSHLAGPPGTRESRPDLPLNMNKQGSPERFE